jgi:hypothetical protein
MSDLNRGYTHFSFYTQIDTRPTPQWHLQLAGSCDKLWSGG